MLKYTAEILTTTPWLHNDDVVNGKWSPQSWHKRQRAPHTEHTQKTNGIYNDDVKAWWGLNENIN